MRIAQIAPLYESVPPLCYGGTERVVHTLTEQLVKMGHDVTLFATADSRTSARLISICPRAIRIDPEVRDSTAWHVYELAAAYDMAAEFDIIHSHVDYLTLPFARPAPRPTVLTLHGRLDLPELKPVYRRFYDAAHLISISLSQKRYLSDANWLGTVYHGLDLEKFAFSETGGDYLLFLGRISPEKRPDLAIETAKRAGLSLKIAAKVDKVDRDYFKTHIEPMLDHPLIEFLGEVKEEEKRELLCGALALIFPIDWPEPFGLVLIESLACGTPVVARPCGSVPEIIEEGVNGLLAWELDGLVEAVKRVERIDRRACRRTAEQRFSAERMASQYLELYLKAIELFAINRKAAEGFRGIGLAADGNELMPGAAVE